MPRIEHHRITADGVSLHYAAVGTGKPIVLVHGFPQSWYQWRSVMERLAAHYRVIAPDLRGIGGVPGPMTGYDKHSLANDIRAIVLAECGDVPVVICGHDMGSFVAFAYALRYRSSVAGLMLIDAPPPGTSAWAAGIGSPRAWHIAFHAQTDIALMLVTGRERAYIEQFITSRAYDPTAVIAEDIDVYAATYAAPGALRSAFRMYAALLDEDPKLNRAALETDGKLELPMVMVGGATMPRSSLAAAAAEIAVGAEVEVIERAGHWIAEEQPERLTELIEQLAEQASGPQ